MTSLHALAISALATLAHGLSLNRDFFWDDQTLRGQMGATGARRLFQPDIFGLVRPGKASLS